MRNLPEQRKESAGKIGSSFCSAVEFLSDAKIGGCTVGILLFFAALIAAMTAHYYFDTFLFVYLLIIVAFAGQVAHILICKREGLRDYLLTTGLRLAGLGAGFGIAYAFLDHPSLLGVLSIVIGTFAGDGILALIRKWYRQA